jgi:hypothetical protein
MRRIAASLALAALASATDPAAAQAISGSVEAGVGYYWNDAAFEPRSQALELRVEGKAGEDDSPIARYSAELILERLPGSGEARVGLGEAWIKLYAGPFDLSFGNQTVAWSVSDVFCPADVVNPWDLSVPVDRKKTPVPIARAVLDSGSFSIDLVAQPYWTAGKMPDARWASADAAALASLPHDSSLDAVPDFSLENAAFGGRVEASLGLLQGIDLGATYYRGRSSSPTGMDFTYAGMYPASYYYIYGRSTFIGADLTIAPGGSLLLKTEWGYTTLDDANPLAPADGEASVQGVSGVEYTLGTAQLEAEYVLDWKKGAPGGELGHGLVGILSWEIGSRASLKLAGAYDFSGSGSGMVSGLAEYKLADGLAVKGEAYAFFGGAATTYGAYRDNGLARASLKYSF